jgi:uncharacterized RDD family membrane protein YckC
MQWRPRLRRLFCADPDSAETGGRRPDLASPRARLLAAVLDLTMMSVALFWVGALGHDVAFSDRGPLLRLVARLFAWVAVLGHVVILEGMSGQTFGKRLVGIRVVDQETGNPIGYWWAAHRAVARALFWFVAFLALADSLMRTVYDRSAGAVVVNIPPPQRSSERMEYETTEEA